MGTLSLIFGVITLLIGLPLTVLLITQKDPYWPMFYAGLVLFGIGIFLIKKYDKDKKKSQSVLYDKSNESSAINILKERYAKGEISKEVFEKMKKNLENS